MTYLTTWYEHERVLSSFEADSFVSARETGRARMAAHRIRSAATHFDVHSAGGKLMFDSRDRARPVPAAPTVMDRIMRCWNAKPA